MKRQFIYLLAIVSFFLCSNAATAQVSPKKKTTPTAVKKAPLANKKSSATPAKTPVAKTAPVAITTTPITSLGRNTCKVTTTKTGCSIVFEFNLDPNSEQAKKGDTYTKREFLVSYLDNSVTEVGKKDAIEGAVKVIKSEAAVMADEVSNAAGQQLTVGIKDLMFVFDVIKDKKQLSSSSNACSLPSKMPDGVYVMTVNWNWDTNIAEASKLYCVTKFNIEIKDGNYVGIKN